MSFVFSKQSHHVVGCILAQLAAVIDCIADKERILRSPIPINSASKIIDAGWLRLAELQLGETRWSARRGKDQRAIGDGDQIDVRNDGRVNGNRRGCSDLSRAGIGIRHNGVLGDAESFSQALIVGEEEELILSVVANCRTAFAEVWQQDWTTHSSAKLIALKRRYG